ncbi:MAG: N-acetylmuramoyl-L-alanine amidase, partial [Evtepia sp.]
PGETARRNQAARAIIRALQNESVNVRGDGLLHNAYSVLTATTAPAVLIEHGFHTNSEDVAQLKTDAFRAKLANADAHGILDFLGIAWKPTIPTTDLNKIKTQERFGFDDNTMAFLNAHPYATDLFRKLANGK